MKYKSFEDYLQTKHDEQYTGTDDDAPDDYSDWVSNLSEYEWIEFGDKYANIYSLERMEEMAKKMIDSISYKPEE